MFRLIKENVERVAIDEAHAQYFESKGYTRIVGDDKMTRCAETSGNVTDMASLTVKELQKIAKARGIQGATGLTKTQLIECLTAEELMIGE